MWESISIWIPKELYRIHVVTPGSVTRPGAGRLVLATGLCYLSMGFYVAVLPGYLLHDRHASTLIVGAAMGITAVAAVGLRPAAGALGDRWGRRRPAMVGAVLLAAGPALLLVPGSPLGLIFAGRALIGVGDALFATATMAWAIESQPAERHGRAMAQMGMGIWLGFALGPQAAAGLRALGGFSAVWLGALVAPALAAALLVGARAPLRETRTAAAGERVMRPPPGSVRPALAMLLALYGNGVFEAFGVVHLTARGVRGGAGLGGAASVFTVVAITTFAARFAGGALADRVSPRGLAALGAAIVAGAYLTFALASSFVVAAVGAVLLGCGQALLYPALGLIVTRQVPAAQRGAGVGTFLSAIDAAIALGSVLGGVLVAGFSTTAALATGSAVALAALPLILAGQGVQRRTGLQRAS
jgi:MFS family permease